LAERYETVIVGGGVAGLACARRLHDSQRSFLLITENIGGRIRTSADGTVNLGAYYVRSDYSHVNRFVDRGRRIRRRQTLRGDIDGSFTRSDRLLLFHPIQAVRFVRLSRRFRRHYETYKQQCLTMSQAQAIESDPLLRGLYHEPASDLIRRYRIEDVARSYLAPAVQGTAFTSMDRLTAFTMLVGVLPLIVPMFEYVPRFDLLTAGFEDALRFDSVTAIESTTDGMYSIQTHNRASVLASNVVVATPIGVSSRLLDLEAVKGAIDAHMFLLDGDLRRPWAQATYALFPEGDTTFAIARQASGLTLFCSDSQEPDFDRYFSAWTVVERHHWIPAFHLLGDVLMECEQSPDLYLVGDHNVCTLEDAYITGIYAANRILATSEEMTPPRSRH
jgi:hypothetical protein